MLASVLFESIDEVFAEKTLSASHSNSLIGYLSDKRITVTVQGSRFNVQCYSLLKDSLKLDVQGSMLNKTSDTKIKTVQC